ncbi:MAG: thiamine-phosphate kinase [Deltaproteobacteria bacterium]|nr:thiamine-phosphate kinase [Deltaproteobacteria bacterium]
MNKSFGEFELIRRLTKGRGIERDDVLKSVGDDAAVIEETDRCLLFTCDAQVAGVHFLMERIPPFTLGQRIAAVNLSDIAAMGGQPLWALCSLLLDKKVATAFYEAVYEGLYDELNRFRVQLIGGNTARSGAGVIADLFVAGEAKKDGVLFRSGARVGDVVCVTGTLGASAAGLHILMNAKDGISAHPKLVERHFRPTPRVAEGQALAASGVVTACMDISDGLLQDASHIAVASDVQIVIDETLVPVSVELQQFAHALGLDGVVMALTGGEDYELMFTTSESDVRQLMQDVWNATGTAVTVVGRVVAADDAQKRVITASGRYWNLEKMGFDHLD